MATLSVGSRGPEVIDLQSMLNGQPPTSLPKLQVDGMFGANTQARVKEYQRDNNLVADGIVGTRTLGKLKSKVRIVLAQAPVSFGFGGVAPRRFGFFSPRISRIPGVGVIPQPETFSTGELGVFAISAAPAMPLISVQIKFEGLSPDPTPMTFFDWTVIIEYKPANDASRGKPDAIFSDSFIVNRVLGGSFTPVFPKIRGGNLFLVARGHLSSGELVESMFFGKIIGADPGQAAIRAEIGDDLLRKIARQESGMQQFQTDPEDRSKGVVPVFNRRRDGGAGVFQVTPPRGDDVWNWRANIRSGKQILRDKRAAALVHLNAHRIDGHFPNNLGLDDEQVVLRETIQRFNGGFHWSFDATTNQWVAQPELSRTYVAEVLAQTP